MDYKQFDIENQPYRFKFSNIDLQKLKVIMILRLPVIFLSPSCMCSHPFVCNGLNFSNPYTQFNVVFKLSIHTEVVD